MKCWRKYIDYLSIGEWHIHTSFTDGDGNISDYCEKAIDLGIPLLAFTEHVRKKISYDFNDFLTEIDEARDEFDLIILSGCEAKILPNGELDVDDSILAEVDYPIFAFHSFPESVDLYIKCLNSVLDIKYVNTWAHPGSFLIRHNLNLPDEELINIFHLMYKKDVLLEINEKYNVPPKNWDKYIDEYKIAQVRGSDVHHINDLKRHIS